MTVPTIEGISKITVSAGRESLFRHPATSMKETGKTIFPMAMVLKNFLTETFMKDCTFQEKRKMKKESTNGEIIHNFFNIVGALKMSI